jgi:hypothetical protein
MEQNQIDVEKIVGQAAVLKDKAHNILQNLVEVLLVEINRLNAELAALKASQQAKE